ncbi:MAG: phosphomannomutase [Pseudomonadota bacterium]
MTSHPAFKAYDIRGRLDREIDETFARALGLAVSRTFAPSRVVLGGDARASSEALKTAVANGLGAGLEIHDLGLCGTEEVYFATDHLGADLGIMITASHNPIDYNGMKIVGMGAAPLSDDAFRALEAEVASLLAERDLPNADAPTITDASATRAAYVARVLSFVDGVGFAPLHLVMNAGHGAAGPTLDAILEGLGDTALRITRVHHDPDATFPAGIPNPLLPENHAATADIVRSEGADLGVAWDGDFDRCFFFDGTGKFIAGEYVVALLAQAMLARFPNSTIIHDPRVQWNTQSVVARAGGDAQVSRTGHAHLKAKMRAVDGAYGGEMSAHHYFREFMYCDTGMIPWLMVVARMSETGASLAHLVDDMARAFPSSGEMNFTVENAAEIMEEIEAEHKAGDIDRLDGLSVAYPNWRFNLRRSSTEPLLRLNVETRGDRALLDAKVAELRARITGEA